MKNNEESKVFIDKISDPEHFIIMFVNSDNKVTTKLKLSKKVNFEEAAKSFLKGIEASSSASPCEANVEDASSKKNI